MKRPSIPCRTVCLLAFALLAGCAGLDGARRTSVDPAPATTEPGLPVVVEAFVSEERREDELDSLATWVGEDGITRVVATAKASHRLVVFDGESGARLHAAGGPGSAPGRFARPNGVSAFGDLVFVVERDAPRVQALRMPDLAPVGSFGDAELRSPYGIWLHETAPDRLDAYVTDGFMHGADHGVVPPPEALGERVRRYRLELSTDRVDARHLGAFGATRGRGVLRIVESIAGDPAHGTLLIADEDRRGGSTAHEYDLEGRFTGRSLPEGTFRGEAEGIALWACGVDDGYWIAVDQAVPHTVFRVFDRGTLVPRGGFRGQVTANTDGVAVHAAATPRFASGVLYAVHDDRALAAFDLGEVARALGLDPACGG